MGQELHSEALPSRLYAYSDETGAGKLRVLVAQAASSGAAAPAGAGRLARKQPQALPAQRRHILVRAQLAEVSTK